MRERKIMNRIFKNEEIPSNVLIVVYLIKCRVLFLSSKRYIKSALYVRVLDSCKRVGRAECDAMTKTYTYTRTHIFSLCFFDGAKSN